MKPHPDPMVRRVLAELYPSPLTRAMCEVMRGVQQTVNALSAAFSALSPDLLSAVRAWSPPTTCRLCGCTGDHHDGCLMETHE